MDSSEPVLNLLGRREFMAKASRGQVPLVRALLGELQAKFRASLGPYRSVSGVFRKKLRSFFSAERRR
jgi:hypothetical protein